MESFSGGKRGWGFLVFFLMQLGRKRLELYRSLLPSQGGVMHVVHRLHETALHIVEASLVGSEAANAALEVTREVRFDGVASVDRYGCMPRRNLGRGGNCGGASIRVAGTPGVSGLEYPNARHARHYNAFASDVEAQVMLKRHVDDAPMHGVIVESLGYFLVASPSHSCRDVGDDVEGRGGVECVVGEGRRRLFRDHDAHREHVDTAWEEAKARAQRRLTPFVDGTRTLGTVAHLVAVVKFSDEGYSSFSDEFEDGESADEFALRKCFENHELAFDDWRRQSFGQVRKNVTYINSVLTLPSLIYGNRPESGSLQNAAEQAMREEGYNLWEYEYHSVCFPDLWWMSWAGLGETPGAFTWINALADWAVISHEHGHNSGLPHANYGDEEYGDITDLMGDATGPGDFHPMYKLGMHWVPPESVANVLPSHSQGEESFVLFPHDLGAVPSYLQSIVDLQRWGVTRANITSGELNTTTLPLLGLRVADGPGSARGGAGSTSSQGLWLSTKTKDFATGADRVLVHWTEGMEDTIAKSVYLQNARPSIEDRSEAGLVRGDAWVLWGEGHISNRVALGQQAMREVGKGERTAVVVEVLLERDAASLGIALPMENMTNPRYGAADRQEPDALCGRGLDPTCSSWGIAGLLTFIDPSGAPARGLPCYPGDGGGESAEGICHFPRISSLPLPPSEEEEEIATRSVSGDALAEVVPNALHQGERNITLTIPLSDAAPMTRRPTLSISVHSRGTTLVLACSAVSNLVLSRGVGSRVPLAAADFGSLMSSGADSLGSGRSIVEFAISLGLFGESTTMDDLDTVCAAAGPGMSVATGLMIPTGVTDKERDVLPDSAAKSLSLPVVPLPQAVLVVGVDRNLDYTDPLPTSNATNSTNYTSPSHPYFLPYPTDTIELPVVLHTITVLDSPCLLLQLHGTGEFARTWTRSTSLPFIRGYPHFTSGTRHLCRWTDAWFVAPDTDCNSYFRRAKIPTEWTDEEGGDPFKLVEIVNGVSAATCQCEGNSYYNETSLTCKPCPPGQYINETERSDGDGPRAQECTCPPGFAWVPSSQVCSSCASGYAKESFGNDQCHTCPDGQDANSDHTACITPSEQTSELLDDLMPITFCDTIIVSGSIAGTNSFGVTTNDGTYTREIGRWYGGRPVYKRTSGGVKYLRAETDVESAPWVLHRDSIGTRWWKYGAMVEATTPFIQRINPAGSVVRDEYTSYYETATSTTLAFSCACQQVPDGGYIEAGGLPTSNPCTCPTSAGCVRCDGPNADVSSDECECKVMYGTGDSCSNVDECSASTSPCKSTSTCVDEDDGYYCTMPNGYGAPAGLPDVMIPCPLGTYGMGNGECVDCPVGSWTSESASSSISNCECIPGLMRRVGAAWSEPCLPPDEVHLWLDSTLHPNITDTFAPWNLDSDGVQFRAVPIWSALSPFMVRVESAFDGIVAYRATSTAARTHGYECWGLEDSSSSPLLDRSGAAPASNNSALNHNLPLSAILSGLTSSPSLHLARLEQSVPDALRIKDTTASRLALDGVRDNARADVVDAFVTLPCSGGSTRDPASLLRIALDHASEVFSDGDSGVTAGVFAPFHHTERWVGRIEEGREGLEAPSGVGPFGTFLRPSLRRGAVAGYAWTPTPADDGRRFALVRGGYESTQLGVGAPVSNASWFFADPTARMGRGGLQQVEDGAVQVDAKFNQQSCLAAVIAAGSDVVCERGSYLRAGDCESWFHGGNYTCVPCSPCDSDDVVESECSALSDTICLDSASSQVPSECTSQAACSSFTATPVCTRLSGVLPRVCLSQELADANVVVLRLRVNGTWTHASEWTRARAKDIARALEWSLKARLGGWGNPDVFIAAVNPNAGDEDLEGARLTAVVRLTIRGGDSDLTITSATSALSAAVLDTSPYSSLLAVWRNVARDPAFASRAMKIGLVAPPVLSDTNSEKTPVVEVNQKLTFDSINIDDGEVSAIVVAASITPSPTPSPSTTPSPSVTPTASLSPGASPSTTPSTTPTPSPSGTPTPSLSPGASPSVTPSGTPSQTPSTTPSASTSASATPSASTTPSASPVPIDTVSVFLCTVIIDLKPSQVNETVLAQIQQVFSSSTGATDVVVTTRDLEELSHLCPAGQTRRRRLRALRVEDGEVEGEGRRSWVGAMMSQLWHWVGGEHEDRVERELSGGGGGEANYTTLDADFAFEEFDAGDREVLEAGIDDFVDTMIESALRDSGGILANVNVNVSLSVTVSYYRTPRIDDDEVVQDLPPGLSLLYVGLIAGGAGLLCIIFVVLAAVCCAPESQSTRRKKKKTKRGNGDGAKTPRSHHPEHA